MSKKVFFSFLLTGFIFLLGNNVFAKDITLAWDANEEPDVVGYRVYYKIDSSSLPFDGTEAKEGVSPVDVGNTLSTTLSGLSENAIVYFAVTAYNSVGEESTFSNVVASDWVPESYFPKAGETVDPQQVEFSWSDAPAGNDATYTLYYGTDPHLNPPPLVSQTFSGSTMMAGAAFFGLLGAGLSTRRKRQAALLLALAATLFILNGCSGGGGSDSTSAAPSDPQSHIGSPLDAQIPGADSDTPAAPTHPTNEVSGITGTSYAAANLQANTTYYWKIVATDAQGKRRESETRSFTTGGY